MIHVVFQEADIDVLKQAIALDASLEGEIRIIRDDFMVGPIAGINETEGYQVRRDWWFELLKNSPYNEEEVSALVDDRLAMHGLKKALEEDENEVLWLWMGQNAHDVCGYYWAISQLQEFSGRIYILYMNNLPFINEKGQIFYPKNIHNILPKEFLKAKKLARKVTPSEFEVDGDEWKKLSAENAAVRILEGGKKIVGVSEDFFDSDILKNLTGEWQKGHRFMHSVLPKLKVPTGDVHILHRVRELEKEGRLQINGDMTKGWKEFEVRLPQAQEVTQEP